MKLSPAALQKLALVQSGVVALALSTAHAADSAREASSNGVPKVEEQKGVAKQKTPATPQATPAGSKLRPKLPFPPGSCPACGLG